MKRTTITLPDDLARALAREARRSDRSASEVARDALARYLGLSADGVRELPFAALGHSGHGHTARDMEELLAREWDDPRDS
jgi:metal-responsive CopG/Arc/MetJ family transcriptional regulator